MREPTTTRARKNLGDSGERVGAMFLEQRGDTILARNYRTRVGEIDLIAQDANGLAFVDVRTRRGDRLGAPEESRTPRKRAHLLGTALDYLANHAEHAECPWRIDLVAFELDRAGRIARMNLIQGAVEE